ncbi:MAG: hypothetical protein PHX70_03870 [Clostridium sp.]|nr:hypothetical protein [Clostridium sp.]
MKKKVCFIITLFIIILGCVICNIQLNRNIYCNEIHMKASEESYRNSENKYNIDDMEEKLDKLQDKIDNPSKYKNNDSDIVFKVKVPKLRVLFSMEPFDLRFETQHHSICFNQKQIYNIEKNIELQKYYINNKISSFTKNIVDFKSKNSILKYRLSQIKTEYGNFLF